MDLSNSSFPNLNSDPAVSQPKGGDLHAQQLLIRGLLTLSVIVLIHVVYNSYLHPISQIPGPFLAKYTELWRTVRYFKGSWLEDIVALHERYGNVVRISPNEVSFVDQGGLKELYGHGKPSQKATWYKVWDIKGLGISFFATRDRQAHRQIRSRVSGTYTMSAILAMETLISDVMDLNLATLNKLAVSEKPFQLDHYVNYFTFDTVGQLAMGGPIGFLEQERDVDDIIDSIHDGFWLKANMGNLPFQNFWHENKIASLFVRRLARTFRGLRCLSFNTFLAWLDDRVDERMKEGLGDRRPDMLQYFINCKDKGGNPVTKGEVMMEATNILSAGADTTTCGILAVLGSLIRNKGVYHQLRSEIDDLYTNSTGEVSYRDLESLPLLTAVIRESMRLHPSITYQLPRVPPPEGVQIAQYHIPSSVVCGISPAAMNRSKEIYGSDALSWNPKRWIPLDGSEEDQKRLRGMEQQLTTFGMGSRSCIGRNLATVEIYKYIATFVRNFDAEFVNKDKPWVTQSQWFSFQRDFWIRLSRRTDL